MANTKNFIEEVEILLEDDWFCFEHDNRRFRNMQFLVSHLQLDCNYIAMDDKEAHKQASQVRFKRRNERLVFCWHCCSYHDQVHYCDTLNKWRKIDVPNLIIINGPTRESVERYKNEFNIEHKVECKLFNSRSLLNQQEKGAVEQLKEERWRKAQQERDALEAKEYWEKIPKFMKGWNV